MKNRGIFPTLAVAVVLGSGAIAHPQDRPPASRVVAAPSSGESRIELGLAFAQTLSAVTFDGSQTIKDYLEDGSFKGAYDVGKAPGGGFDLQYNFGAKLGLRLGAQTFSRKSLGTFDAQVPHPFFFSKPRTVHGTVSDLSFTEAAVSLTGVYRGGSGKWKLNLEGGPAYFSVDATLAEKLTLNEVYPYDTVAFNGVASSKKKVSPIGFAVGLEIGREISSAVIVVAQGRFTQGSADVTLGGSKMTVKSGGAQARIGVRLILARKKVSP